MSDWLPFNLFAEGFCRKNFWPRERWWKVVEYSTIERMNMIMKYDDSRRRAFLRDLYRNSTLYQIETPTDILRSILTIDISLADLLDKYEIPRKWEGWEYRALYGPMPEQWGPHIPVDEPVIRRVMPGLVNSDELKVQPMMTHIPSLPVLGFVRPTDWTDTLKALTEVTPLSMEKFPDYMGPIQNLPVEDTVQPKQFKIATAETFSKVSDIVTDIARKQGYQVDD